MKTYIIPVFDSNERQFGTMTVLAPSEQAAIDACTSEHTPWTDADGGMAKERETTDNDSHDIECDEHGNVTFSVYDDEEESEEEEPEASCRLTCDVTNRGFATIHGTDLYGDKFSIQKSSLATDLAIWFGIDDAAPKVMASKAKELGVETTETTGWVPYPIPSDVLLTTRMHLTMSQVRELLPILQHFVDTGCVKLEEEAKP